MYYMPGVSFVIYGKPAIRIFLGVRVFVRENDQSGKRLKVGSGREIAGRSVLSFLKHFIPNSINLPDDSSRGKIRKSDLAAISNPRAGKTPAELVGDIGRDRELPILGTHTASLSEIIASAGVDPESGPERIVLSETQTRYLFQRTDDDGRLLLAEAIRSSNKDFLDCFTKSPKPNNSRTLEFAAKNGREPALLKFCALLQEITGINYVKENRRHVFAVPAGKEEDFDIAVTSLTYSYFLFPHILPEHLRLIFLGIVGEIEKTQGGQASLLDNYLLPLLTEGKISDDFWRRFHEETVVPALKRS